MFPDARPERGRSVRARPRDVAPAGSTDRPNRAARHAAPARVATGRAARSDDAACASVAKTTRKQRDAPGSIHPPAAPRCSARPGKKQRNARGVGVHRFIGGAPISSEELRFHRRSRTRASVESTAGPERPGPIETGRSVTSRSTENSSSSVARSSGNKRERFLPPSLPRVSHHILVLVSSTIFPRSSTLNSSRILTFMRSIEKTCVITHVPSFSPDRRGPSLRTLGV